MPAALERSYDGIIIGAGHHGLVLGSYLARCGLDILLVDRRLQYGGALVTEEVTAPGFYHNLHSINHFHISETPWFKDLGLGDRVTYITPRYEFGQPHLDGIGAGVRARSRGDARQRRALLQEGRRDLSRLEPQGRGDHGPHLPAGALLRAAAAGRARGAAVAAATSAAIFSRRRSGSRSTWCEELFENEHVQLLFLFKISLFGTWLVDTHVEDEPDGLGDPRLRPAERLPALQGRLGQPGARPDGDIHRGRRAVRAAGRARAHRDRGRQGDRNSSRGRTHRARPAVRRQHARTCTRPSRTTSDARSFRPRS